MPCHINNIKLSFKCSWSFGFCWEVKEQKPQSVWSCLWINNWSLNEKPFQSRSYWAPRLLFESFNRRNIGLITNTQYSATIITIDKDKMAYFGSYHSQKTTECHYEQPLKAFMDDNWQQQEEMAVNGSETPEISFSSKEESWWVGACRFQVTHTFNTPL